MTQELGVIDEHWLAASNSAYDRRHAGIVAIADSDGLALLEIDTVEVFDKGRDEMLPCLFAIADDIDAGVLLLLQGQTQRVLLALDQFITLQLPWRPELLGLGEPGGFGQAAGSGGG